MTVCELINNLNELNPNAEIFLANANNDSDGVNIINIETNDNIVYFICGDFETQRKRTLVRFLAAGPYENVFADMPANYSENQLLRNN